MKTVFIGSLIFVIFISEYLLRNANAEFKEVIDLHLSMEKQEVDITDDYRNLR